MKLFVVALGVFTASCAVLAAGQGIANGELVSETALDTVRIQAALTGCAAGQAVELVASGTNTAFLTGPLSLPTGVTLLVDGGVTLFGSRNPADYQSATAGVETCGTVGTAGNGCMALITSSGANSAVMGYGVIDGRGQDKLIVNGNVATYSWWDQAGTAQNTSGGAQNNPILMWASGANLISTPGSTRSPPRYRPIRGRRVEHRDVQPRRLRRLRWITWCSTTCRRRTLRPLRRTCG